MSDTPKLIQFLINHDNPKHAISGCRDLQELEDARQWITEWNDHSVTHSMIDVDAAMDALTDRIDELKHGSPLIRTLKQHHILGQLDAHVKALGIPDWPRTIIGFLPEHQPVLNQKSTLRPLLDKMARPAAEWSAEFFNDPESRLESDTADSSTVPSQHDQGTPTGWDAPPPHYAQQERETIDRIRDELGDPGFVAFCRGNVIKYRDRKDAKGDPQGDEEKALWYEMMALHVEGDAHDPRALRPGFTGYQRDVQAKALEAVEERTIKPSSAEAFAADLYSAYGNHAAWQNFQGNEMPQWGALPIPIRAHWIAVAIRASIQTPGASPHEANFTDTITRMIRDILNQAFLGVSRYAWADVYIMTPQARKLAIQARKLAGFDTRSSGHITDQQGKTVARGYVDFIRRRAEIFGAPDNAAAHLTALETKILELQAALERSKAK